MSSSTKPSARGPDCADHRPRASVVHAMGRIGKVVFAGLITAAVLLSVVTQDDTIGKVHGLGLGLAVVIDVLAADPAPSAIPVPT